MQARDVLDVLAILDDAEVSAWVSGGWGIAALLGAQHRDHRDLDLFVLSRDLDQAIAALGEVGFEATDDARPVEVRLADRGERRVDLQPVLGDGRGRHWRPSDISSVDDGRFSGEELTTGWIGGQMVPCIGLALQLRYHRGYIPGEADIEDLQQLRERFGVDLPAGY